MAQLVAEKMGFGQGWNSPSIHKQSTTLHYPPASEASGDFIEIRHKKNLPTRILSALWCLSLCNSVTLSLCGQ